MISIWHATKKSNNTKHLLIDNIILRMFQKSAQYVSGRSEAKSMNQVQNPSSMTELQKKESLTKGNGIASKWVNQPLQSIPVFSY